MVKQILDLVAIDDEESVLMVVREVLERSGYGVRVATSGRVGIEKVLERPPDAVLLDIDMPGMTGLQVLQVLRQSAATADLTVIMLTGNPDPELVDRAFQLGADDYLRKPLSVRELQARMRHIARIKQANNAVASLRELNRLKEDFIAVLSHELRTPLTSIIGFSDIFKEGIAGPLTNEQLEFIDIIQNRAKELHHLLESLLELNLIRLGERQIHVQQVSMNSVIQGAVDYVNASLKEHSHQLQVHVAEPELQVIVDPQVLHRVLITLLENAIKFTPDGGTIAIEARYEHTGLTICVSDNGIGISAELLPVIFDCFRQLEGHATRRFEGLGIGLTIASRLISLHKGHIWVESTEGVGSIFTIFLPREEHAELMAEDRRSK